MHFALLQVVQRVTLQAIMPDAASVIKNLFKTLTIQEPTFKDVVILYRRKPDAGGGSDEKDPKAEFNQVEAGCDFDSNQAGLLLFIGCVPLAPEEAPGEDMCAKLHLARLT